MSKVLGWLLGLAAVAATCVVTWVLGKMGQLVRRGVETKKALRAALIEARTTNPLARPNDKYHEMDTHASKLIWGPISGWLVVYSGLYLFLPLEWFCWSLVALVPVGMGYFGIFFVPSVD